MKKVFIFIFLLFTITIKALDKKAKQELAIIDNHLEEDLKAVIFEADKKIINIYKLLSGHRTYFLATNVQFVKICDNEYDSVKKTGRIIHHLPKPANTRIILNEKAGDIKWVSEEISAEDQKVYLEYSKDQEAIFSTLLDSEPIIAHSPTNWGSPLSPEGEGVYF